MAAFRYSTLSVSFLTCLAFACHARKEEEEEAPQPSRVQANGSVRLTDDERRALDLQVAIAQEDELPEVSLRFGRVRPVSGGEALVVSPFAGRIPRPPLAMLGASVEQGAALVEVVPMLAANERISVDVSAAQLGGQVEATTRELATQETARDRARELAASQIVSEAKLQEAETLVASTRAKLEALRRAIGAQSKGQDAPMMMRSPIAGTIVVLNAQVGSVVQQGDVLVRMLRPGPRWIDVNVAPEDPVGQRYEVKSGDAWSMARLIAPGAVVEADGARHDRLELGAKDSVLLVAGQTVEVRVARGLARGVVVPEESVLPGAEGEFVFVETAPGIYVSKTVKIATRFAGRVRLSGGIAVNEKVVVRGGMALAGELHKSLIQSAD